MMKIYKQAQVGRKKIVRNNHLQEKALVEDGKEELTA